MPAGLPPTTFAQQPGLQQPGLQQPGPPQSGAPGQPYYKPPGGIGPGLIVVLVLAFLAMIVIPLTIATRIGNNFDDQFIGADEADALDVQIFANDDGPLGQAEIERITTINRCTAPDGQPTAEVTLVNDSDGERSYSITMEFQDESGRLLDGFVDITLERDEEREFTSRGPQLSTGRELECNVGSVFRFVG